MFALALSLSFLDRGAATEAPTISLTFHNTRDDARNKVIEEIVSNTQPHIKTLEDFLAELKAGGDLEKVDVDFNNMTWEETLQWIFLEALGGPDEAFLSYEIKEVPTSL